jgi:twitching motility protein PilT
MAISLTDILWLLENIPSLSDVHLCVWSKISYRNIGEIKYIEDKEVLTQEDMESIMKEMLWKYANWYERYLQNREMDINYYSSNWTPFRVNTYFKLNKMAAAMRKIAYKPIPLENLIYDDVANAIKANILNQKNGLFLVTWPTWSWKTTTLIAMLEHLNHVRNEHLITIEDPIEFIFEQKNCLISQRELWSDTLSYANAMRSAMREDPDIIFVGEIRDPETAEAALNLAETWHLVFSTLHTKTAASTVYRLVSLFPSEIQDSIKDRIAQSLLGVQSQYLLQTKDWKSRVWLYEFMINSTAVRNDIRKNAWRQIDAIIETSRQLGMISHLEYAKRLIADGRIDKSAVDWLLK